MTHPSLLALCSGIYAALSLIQGAAGISLGMRGFGLWAGPLTSALLSITLAAMTAGNLGG